jgi:uncharacterized membrane protein YidH (DUF202 family)
MDKNKAIFPLIWGVLLLLMGVLLFFQVPQVMERIVQIEYYASIKWIIRIIIYVIAVILIGGGAKKIYENYKHLKV